MAPTGYTAPSGGVSGGAPGPEQAATGNAPQSESLPAGQGASSTPTSPETVPGDGTSSTSDPGNVELDPPTEPPPDPDDEDAPSEQYEAPGLGKGAEDMPTKGG